MALGSIFRFSMEMYFSLFMVPSHFPKNPTPGPALRTVTEAGCQTLSVRHAGLHSSPNFLLTNVLPVWLFTSNPDSSLMNTFCHFAAVQFLWRLAQYSLASLWFYVAIGSSLALQSIVTWPPYCLGWNWNYFTLFPALPKWWAGEVSICYWQSDKGAVFSRHGFPWKRWTCLLSKNSTFEVVFHNNLMAHPVSLCISLYLSPWLAYMWMMIACCSVVRCFPMMLTPKWNAQNAQPHPFRDPTIADVTIL